MIIVMKYDSNNDNNEIMKWKMWRNDNNNDNNNENNEKRNEIIIIICNNMIKIIMNN